MLRFKDYNTASGYRYPSLDFCRFLLLMLLERLCLSWSFWVSLKILGRTSVSRTLRRVSGASVTILRDCLVEMLFLYDCWFSRSTNMSMIRSTDRLKSLIPKASLWKSLKARLLELTSYTNWLCKIWGTELNSSVNSCLSNSLELCLKAYSKTFKTLTLIITLSL